MRVNDDTGDGWGDLDGLGQNVVRFAKPVGMDERPTPDYGPEDLHLIPGEPTFVEPDASPASMQWPSPFDMFDEAAIQPRQWLYGRHYLRSFVSVLASAGGIGKTSLQIVEALAICTGKPILGETVHEPCPVWIVNLEDPLEEMQRRILAAMKLYGIHPDEVRGRLYLDAGREFQIKFATQTRDGVVPNKALIDHMTQKIRDCDIGATFIDPFVGTHDVNENDNGAINAVVAQIRAVADHTKSAIGLVHHIRKGNGEDATIDSVRGAGSLIGAARCVRVINRMSKDEAEKMGIDPLEARSLFRVDDGKANLAPPADKTVWRRMEGVQLTNGDWVGVATAYEPPDTFDGVTVQTLIAVQNEVDRRCKDGRPPRYSDQSGHDWAGHIVAEFTGLDATDDAKRIRKLIADWIKSGALKKGQTIDETRRSRPTVEVGEWAVI